MEVSRMGLAESWWAVMATVRRHVIPAALDVLPPEMTSVKATRLLLAIGWQESRFLHRAQIGGPARGFWQFEMGGGVHGVLAHSQTHDTTRDAMRALCYRHTLTPLGCYQAIEHNDIVAAVFARLLLWTLPDQLADDEVTAWNQYLAAWRPGKPKSDTWATAWALANQ